MKILIVLLSLTLTGCTAFSAGVQRGADAYDEALAVAEGAMCRAASVRSVIDRYGRDPEAWKAWLYICGYVRDNLEKPEPQ